MQDAFLRRQKDRLMTPVAGPAFAAIHPNLISVAAMVIGLGSVAAILGQWYWLGLALWAVNRIMDGLDGVVARVHGKQSDFGGYLDLFLDFCNHFGNVSNGILQTLRIGWNASFEEFWYHPWPFDFHLDFFGRKRAISARIPLPDFSLGFLDLLYQAL